MENKIIKARISKRRIRTIFKTMRAMERFSSWSDLVLLNIIVIYLDELRMPYSKSEIYSSFKLVDKDNYYPGVKKILIKNLIKNAMGSSVF